MIGTLPFLVGLTRTVISMRLKATRRGLRGLRTLNAATNRRKECTTIIRTAFFSSKMRRGREWFRKALIRSGVRIEYFRPPSFALVHDARVFELLDTGFLSSTMKRL